MAQGSGFIPGSALDAARPHLVRGSSVILLILSFLATIAAFHQSDWSVFLDPQRFLTTRTSAAVGTQVWCTAFQWLNRKKKRSFWYWHALIIDVFFTTVGDLPVAILMIAGFLGIFGIVARPLGLPGVFASVTLVIVVAFPITLYFAFQNAWLPENRIIRE